MKIVIAAWHVVNSNVGLGRYTRHLVEALGRLPCEHEFEILLPTGQHGFPAQPNVRYRCFRIPMFRRRVWEQVAPLSVQTYDLLHFPYDSCVARKRGKFVVTIHDMKPHLFPGEQRRSPRRMIQRWCLPHPRDMIDHVFTVSRCSQRDIVNTLDMPEDRVTVIPQGVDHSRFAPLNEERCDESEQAPYILCVAGTDPTKNVEAVIAAYAMLDENIRQHYRLMLVGDLAPRGELRELAVHHGVAPRVSFAGVLSDADLVRAYQRAAVFVFPSLYEGFGLPVLEAMACGCPVICSNTSSLPEVVGDAAVMVAPLDHSALAHAMETVLTEDRQRDAMRAAGLARAQTFSWERTARETVAAYERVATQTR